MTVGIPLGGMQLGADRTLADKDLTLILTGSGSTGIVDIGIAPTFGGDDNNVCDLPWRNVTIDVGFPFCCADVAPEVYFTCAGFGYAEFDAKTSLQISDQFTVGMGLVYDVTAGLQGWKLTFDVTW